MNFAATSENKFVASRSMHALNKLNHCCAFVVKHTVNCFLKSVLCILRPFLFFLLLPNLN